MDQKKTIKILEFEMRSPNFGLQLTYTISKLNKRKKLLVIKISRDDVSHTQ